MGEDVFGVEAGFDSAECEGGADQQGRADQEYDGESDFTDCQQSAGFVLAKAGAGAAAIFLEGGGQIGPRGLQGGNQPEQDAGGHGNDNSEHEHAPVEGDQGAVLADAGKVGGVDAEQGANPDDSGGGSDRSADQGEEYAFGEQLADDAGTSSAHGDADGHFATAADGACQEEIGDVGTGDQEDEADGAGEHQDGRANVADEGLADGFHAEALIVGQGGGELAAEVGCGDLEAGFGLIHGHAGFQAAADGEVVALVLGIGIELKGYPDIGGWTEFAEVEGGPDDADDDVGIAAEGDGFAEDLRVTGKAALPAGFAEDGDFLSVGRVFLEAENVRPRRTGAPNRRK